MFARVRLITKDVAEALVVPEQALVPQGNEQFVFKIVDNKAVRIKVDVGQRRDGKVGDRQWRGRRRHRRDCRPAQAARRLPSFPCKVRPATRQVLRREGRYRHAGREPTGVAPANGDEIVKR